MLLAASSVRGFDSRVYVSGTIADNTCSSSGSENINVAMGAVSQRQFYRAGDRFRMAAFCYRFTGDCGSTASGVTVGFGGADGRP